MKKDPDVMRLVWTLGGGLLAIVLVGGLVRWLATADVDVDWAHYVAVIARGAAIGAVIGFVIPMMIMWRRR